MYNKSVIPFTIISGSSNENRVKKMKSIHKKLKRFEHKKKAVFTKSIKELHASCKKDVNELSNILTDTLVDDNGPENVVYDVEVDIDVIEMDDFFED